MPALAAAGALTVAALAAYCRTFAVPLLYDDYDCIVSNPTLRHLGAAFWPPIASTVGGRPVLNLSLAVNYAISGLAVGSYHLANLAIHILAGLALFGIVRHALASRRDQSATLIACSAALIWLVHPLQTESVTYIIQRAESLMGLLYLLTLYLFVRGAGAEGPGARAWFALSFAACLLGMATKEVMVSAPLVVLLYDRTFIAGSFSAAWQRRRRVYIALGSTWILLAFLVVSSHGRGGTAGPGSGVPWLDYAVTQFPAIAHYLRLCFLPTPLIFDYGAALDLRAIDVVPSACVVLGLLALTAWALVRHPAIGFLGACFFAILAPSSSVIPVATEAMAEHRMYVALAPVVVLVVVGIYRVMGRAGLPVCLVAAVALAWATYQRNETYRSDEGLWRDTVAHRPGNERAHNDLGFVLSRTRGGLDEAVEQYADALRIKPDYAEAHYNLGTAFEMVPGLSREAIAQFQAALRLVPNFAEAHNNLGIALSATPGGASEAIVQYREALRLKPDYAQAHFDLGSALQGTPGGLDEAITQYNEAIRLMPGLVEAHSNLGTALFSQGRLPDAVTQYGEALRLRPDDVAIRLNLAYALLRIPGKSDEAVADLNEILRLHPDNTAARQVLAEINPREK